MVETESDVNAGALEMATGREEEVVAGEMTDSEEGTAADSDTAVEAGALPVEALGKLKNP